MSTPPLSRQNSTDHLNLSEELTEEKSSSEKEKQTAESSSSQIKQILSAWKVAQASTDTLESPRLRNKKGQSHLGLASAGTSISQPHTAPVKKLMSRSTSKEVNSNLPTNKAVALSSELSSAALSGAEQFISIRTAVVQLPSSSSRSAISSENSSGDSSSSMTAVVSPNGKTKIEVDASKLPGVLSQIIDIGLQKNYILRPEQLANLMVTVESQSGKKISGSNNSNTILREPLFIANYQGASGALYKKINIMERFCEPFVLHHLDLKILDELLQKVMREYNKVAERVTKLSEALRPVEQVNHPEVVALMAPVMKLMGDYFLGEDMALASSKFPSPIKNLFLAIDRQAIKWFEKMGVDEMRDLTQLRKTALIGFISTYTFMTIWGPKLAADTRQGAGFYAKLASYINSYLVNKLDPFVMNILLNQEHQSQEAKMYVSEIVKARKSNTKSASASRLRGADKGGRLSAIKNLFSPRSRSVTISNAKPKGASGDDIDFNEEEIRQREMQRGRIVDLTAFAKKSGIYKIAPNFYLFIRNKVINLKANDYVLFTKNPVDYCRQQLKIFILQEDKKNRDLDLFKKIEQSLNSYVEKSESDSESESEKSPYKASTQGLALASNSLSVSNRADQQNYGHSVTESSSSGAEQKFNERNKDVQPESDLGSAQAESDSSTSVETEETDE